MAEVELNLLNIFALRTNKKNLLYEGQTVEEVIKKFVKEYKNLLDNNLLDKKKRKLNPQMVVLLNGKNVNNGKNVKTKVQDGDKIYISYPISGG